MAGIGDCSEILSARELQQEFARLYGTGNSIIWDLYTSTEKDAVLNKLKFLIPDNEIDMNVFEKISDDRTISSSNKTKKFEEYLSKLEKKNVKLAEHRNGLADAIWAQRKYCNKDLLMSIIFVLVSPTQNVDEALTSTTYSCHPLFRIRKCRYQDNSEDCCMIIVDENSRVYQDWSDYVNNNALPKGTMIAPKRGVYTFGNFDEVNLETHITPAASQTRTALKAVDITSSILGASVAVIPAATLFVPVAVPLLIFSSVTGISAGLWSIGRSVAHLVDRGTHEQSINITDRQARFSWLGIAGGVLGLGATGATTGIVNYAAKGGEVSQLAKVAVNGVNAASLTVNGLGIGNGVAELILKAVGDEPISTVDILQLSASLVLFTHSIYNFQYVSNIIKTNNISSLDQFRNMLGQSQRQIFDKFVRQAQRLFTKNTPNRIDIIRGSGSIPDYKYSNGLEAPMPFNPMHVANAVNVVQKIVEEVTGVVNTIDLRNCIFHMIEKITYSIIETLIEITTEFFARWGDSIQRKLKRVLPFEQVLWKAFNIMEILIGANITRPLVRAKAEEIITKLKDMYEANAQQTFTENKKCSKCRGYYSVTPC